MILAFCVYSFSYLVGSDSKLLQPKIVGGQRVKITDYPYSALLAMTCPLRQTEIKDNTWMCGGSILNQKLILTAGHCLVECTADSRVLIFVGHEDINKGHVINGTSFIVHENYNRRLVKNDVALVNIQESLKLDASVSRVAIMKSPPYQEKAQVAGWGVIDEEHGYVEPYLKVIDQFVWQKWDCLKLMRRPLKGAICASSDKVGDYASVGDSGSALVVHGYIQIGLVSFKRPSVNNSVIVYTDTGYFYNWIKKSAELLICI